MNKLIISFLLAFIVLLNTGSAYAKDDRCEKTEFKSWDKLKASKALSYLENDSSITITTSCKVKFHKDFSFATTKDLSITAKKIELKKDTSLSAKRLLLVASKELKLKKNSQICADIIILETAKLKSEGAICPQAQVLGSAVGEASAVAILEVTSDSQVVPAQVSFDWSKSFGVFSQATVDLGDGRSLVSNDKALTAAYEVDGIFQTSVTLQTPSAEVVSNIVQLELAKPNPIADFAIWHIIRRGGTPPEVWFSPNIYPLVKPGVQIKEYRWRFGEGTELVMPFNESPSGFVSFNYPSMGVYDVQVDVVTETGFSKTASLTIDLNNPSVPVPKYKVSSFKGGSPLTVTFTGEAYDGPDETITYNWYFSDTGEQYFGPQFQEVTHTFNSEGVHYVYLETRDDLRGRRITYIPIYVGDVPEFSGVAPVAITDSTARFGEGPLTIDFSGIRSFDPSGSEIPLSYHWEFGDYRSGELNQAFSANATHTFNHPGSYFVNLTVTNSLGLSHSEFMLVSVDGPEVNDIDFEVTPTENPNEFVFSAYGYFAETDYSMESARWAFGDNTYLTYDPYVVHQYASTGTYDVELKIRRLDGAFDSYTRRLVVDANQQAPSINILKQSEWFNLGQAVQLSADFLLGQASDKTIYRWSLGDQTIVKGQGNNFKALVHTYSSPEDKNIRLTVTGENGLTTTVDSYIRHNKFAPEIDDIKIYGLKAPAPVRLVFAPYENTRDLDGNLSHFIYEFGDGSPSITTVDGRLEHTYAQSGSYLVSVTVVDIMGLSSKFEKQIVVKENQTPILSDFNIFYSGEPAPATAAVEAWPFISDVDGQITIYEYTWGDGAVEQIADGYRQHLYSNAGNFEVRVRVQDNMGAWSDYVIKSLTVKANQPPILSNFNLQYSGEPAPATIGVEAWPFVSDVDGFINSYEYAWGDGVVEQTADGYGQHLYSQSGDYQVGVRAQDNSGNWSQAVTKLVTIKANQPPVLSDFNIYDNGALVSVALGAEAWPYSGDSDGYVTTYEYNWGDGVIEQVPDGYRQHTYSAGGNYSIIVRVQDNRGAWSDYVSKTVTIKVNQAPIITHVPVYGNINEPAPVHLAFAPHEGAIDDQYIARWNYDWGDGSPVLETTDGYVEHDFLFPGSFNVVITAFDPYGLSSSYTIPLIIKANQAPTLADFNLNIPSGRAPIDVSVEAWPFVSDVDGTINLYEVNWGDGQVLQGTEGYWEHTYQVSGDFQVSVRVQDNYGLWSESVTKTAIILGNQAPIAKIVADKTVALVPATIHLSALESSDPESDPLIYEWTRPDGTTSNEAKIDIELIEAGQKTVKLKVTDSFGAEATASIVLEGKIPFENTIILSKSSEVAPSTLTMRPGALYDNDSNPLTFEWFINGEKKSEEANFSIVINEPSSVDIMLVSIDDDGFKYQTLLSETLNAPPLYFALNQYEAYAQAGSSIELQILGLELDSPDYQVEITANDLGAVIENVSANSFKVTSPAQGVPIEITVTASNGTNLYERRAVVEFVLMQEVFNQTVADIPMPVEYQGEILMQVSSPVEGNILVKLGDTSKGQMIVEVSSNDFAPKRISVLGLNSNYSVTASQFGSSFHMGENIGSEKSPINDLTRDWVKICHTPDPDSKRTIFKFDPDITPDLVDPVYLRELTLDNQSKVKIGFRRSLASLFLNQQGELDESLPAVVALKNALDRGAFDSLLPIWVLSMDDPFLKAKNINPEKDKIDGFVSSHLQVVHIFKEAILREKDWSDKKDYYPFFLLAHEYRHIEQYENCDFINNLAKFDVVSGAVIAESSADLSAMKKVTSIPDDGTYAQVNEYNEVRSPLGLNADVGESIIRDGLLDPINDKQQYSNELFFDLLVDNEFEFVRKVIGNSAMTSHIPLLQNYINTPGYDFPALATNYLTSFPDRYSRLGFDIHQASLIPTDGASNPIGPYGFGYLKIPAWNIQNGLADNTFKLRIQHTISAKFLPLMDFYDNGVGSLGSIKEDLGAGYSDLEITVNPEHLESLDGFFGIANNSWEAGKFRVTMINDRCISEGDIGLPEYIKDKFSTTYDLVKTFQGQDAQFSLPTEIVDYFESPSFVDSYIVDYFYNYNGKRFKMKSEQDFTVPYYRDGHNLISTLQDQNTNMDIVISKKNIDEGSTGATCKTYYKRIVNEDVYPIIEIANAQLDGIAEPSTEITIKVSYPTYSQHPNVVNVNQPFLTQMKVASSYDETRYFPVTLNIGQDTTLTVPLIEPLQAGGQYTYGVSFELPNFNRTKVRYVDIGKSLTRQKCYPGQVYSLKRRRCGYPTGAPQVNCNVSISEVYLEVYIEWRITCRYAEPNGDYTQTGGTGWVAGQSTRTTTCPHPLYYTGDCPDPDLPPPLPDETFTFFGVWYDYVADEEKEWATSATVSYPYPF